MNRLNKKVFLLIVFTFIICLVFCNVCKASTNVKIEPDYSGPSEGFKGFGQELFGIIKNFAAIISVALMAFCGLRILLGSAEEKADYKKSLMPLIIGSFVVFSATTIVSIVQSLVK